MASALASFLGAFLYGTTFWTVLCIGRNTFVRRSAETRSHPPACGVIPGAICHAAAVKEHASALVGNSRVQTSGNAGGAMIAFANVGAGATSGAPTCALSRRNSQTCPASGQMAEAVRHVKLDSFSTRKNILHLGWTGLLAEGLVRLPRPARRAPSAYSSNGLSCHSFDSSVCPQCIDGFVHSTRQSLLPQFSF